MSAAFDAVVVGLHLPWKGVWQRPNHLLSRFARRVPVFVLEEPQRADDDRDEVAEVDGLTVISPHRRAWDDTTDARAIATVRSLLGDRRPLVWLYTPQMLPLADAFHGAPLAFDKMDELATFLHADPRVAAREPIVLQRAAVVFAGGRTLYQSIAGRSGNARCYPSGVDVAHFAAAHRERPRTDAVADLRLVYTGVIDERLDLGLLADAAALRPAWRFEIVGPVAKIDPARLPVAENVHYPGKRAYEELPQLLAGFDVAIMPFARNEATRSISPTKTLEYLAAGLPVVSTSIPDVVAEYAQIVRLADDAPAFVAAAEAAVVPDPERERLAAERVQAADWDMIAAAMWDDVERALHQGTRPEPANATAPCTSLTSPTSGASRG